MTEAEQERAAVVAWIKNEAARLRKDIEGGYWDGDEDCGDLIAQMYDDTAWVIEHGEHLKENGDA